MEKNLSLTITYTFRRRNKFLASKVFGIFRSFVCPCYETGAKQAEEAKWIWNVAGCVHDGVRYGSGSAMMGSRRCEYCYCISGTRRCIRPKCLLPLPGCTPLYAPHSCCPVAYNCTRECIFITATCRELLKVPYQWFCLFLLKTTVRPPWRRYRETVSWNCCHLQGSCPNWIQRSGWREEFPRNVDNATQSFAPRRLLTWNCSDRSFWWTLTRRKGQRDSVIHFPCLFDDRLFGTIKKNISIFLPSISRKSRPLLRKLFEPAQINRCDEQTEIVLHTLTSCTRITH